MKTACIIRTVVPTMLWFVLCGMESSAERQLSCKGNIETSHKKLVQPGVEYSLWYHISGSSSQIRFAGREFDATVKTGSSWKGQWIVRMDNEIYFSFMPDEGGSIKFEFESNRWYSGNCVE